MTSPPDGPVTCRPRQESHLLAYRATAGNLAALADWCDGRLEDDHELYPPHVVLWVDRDPRFVRPGDVVVRGVTGLHFVCDPDASTGPRPPRNLSLRLPDDVAALLHRLAYETGRSKHDLVIDAIRQTYRDAREQQES